MRLLCALTLWGLAAGCTETAPAPGPGRSVPAPLAFRSELILADSEAALDAGLGATRFNFTHLRDLWFRAKVSGMPRVSVATITFVSAQGELFYQDAFPFSPDPTMKQMTMSAVSHPLTVRSAKTIPGGFALDHTVPISGTVFERYPSAGQWEVQVAIEGVPGTLSSAMEVEYTR